MAKSVVIKQVCRLSETAQETPTTVYGSLAKFADSINSYRKRLQWEMALMVDTYPGEEGIDRKVRIRNQNGEYDRPIHKLCVIATKQELCVEEQP